MHGLKLLVVAVLGTSAITTSGHSQNAPTIDVLSGNRDSILAALHLEAREAGLSLDRRAPGRVVFEKDMGRQLVRGEMVTIVLEMTVQFTEWARGTRLTVTETLNAAMPTGNERRTPDPRERWDAYMNILERTRARIERGPASESDSAQ